MQGKDQNFVSDSTENENATSARRRKNKLLLDSHNYSLNELSKLIERIAETDSNIFLLGDSSASNEVVARAIHALSARSKHLFASLDCEDVSSDVLESHLFGMDKGAFSPTSESHVGILERCNNGTILLNNVDELNSALQEKLLRAIQTGAFVRTGSNSSIELNIRVISSAQKDIANKIDADMFLANLFKCLNQSTISMPPLRRSSEDIPELIFMLTKNIKHGANGSYLISRDAVKILSENTWPASAGELANFLGSLCVLYPPDSSIRNEASIAAQGLDSKGSRRDMELPVRQKERLQEAGINLKKQMAIIEVQYIREALELSDGVVAKAAKLLGLRRTTLVEKLRKYGIQR